MTDPDRLLLKALRRLRRRARTVRGIRLSGRALLAYSVLLFAVLVAREYLRGRYGIDVLPWSAIVVGVAGSAGIVLVLGAAAAAARLTGPGVVETARVLDARRRTGDLVASGLAAKGAPGPVAREVVRRAAAAADREEPEELFPARRSLAKSAAGLPLAMALVVLLGLSPGEGALPLGGGRPGASREQAPEGGRTAGPATPSREEPAGVPEDGAEPDTPPAEAPADPAPPAVDRILARLVPAKQVYEPSDPVTLFLHARPGGELSRAHSLALSLIVDGGEIELGRTATVGPGEGRDALETVFAREYTDAALALTPGKHRVAAALTEGGTRLLTEEVEIEIRGPPGGGGAPEPKPKPRPSGAGAPPPPPADLRPRFVNPLFGPGETREKEGFALVPDPDAPAGTPPRRLPLSEALGEIGRRPEAPVPVEKPAAGDRELVRRYFDALRSGR